MAVISSTAEADFRLLFSALTVPAHHHLDLFGFMAMVRRSISAMHPGTEAAAASRPPCSCSSICSTTVHADRHPHPLGGAVIVLIDQHRIVAEDVARHLPSRLAHHRRATGGVGSGRMAEETPPSSTLLPAVACRAVAPGKRCSLPPVEAFAQQALDARRPGLVLRTATITVSVSAARIGRSAS